MMKKNIAFYFFLVQFYTAAAVSFCLIWFSSFYVLIATCLLGQQVIYCSSVICNPLHRSIQHLSRIFDIFLVLIKTNGNEKIVVTAVIIVTQRAVYDVTDTGHVSLPLTILRTVLMSLSSSFFASPRFTRRQDQNSPITNDP